MYRNILIYSGGRQAGSREFSTSASFDFGYNNHRSTPTTFTIRLEQSTIHLSRTLELHLIPFRTCCLTWPNLMHTNFQQPMNIKSDACHQ
ncbi:hypothetical protein PAHAL_6G179300 [Panicum hallii]|uniref:Uncharacterized protein n=1 Tax=Panicum hallii TaxID=206008 RepID=A0A2S3I241_9POAL|nr:hypothetical protein PAHAL_6G179300 [Panicum hallii]